jgi:hypothetical protein
MSTIESEVPVSKPRNWGSIIATLLVCLCLLAASSCVYNVWTSALERSRRYECKNKLNAIGIALHNYQDRFGEFPPAVARDDNGNAMHSWRALILPFLEEGPFPNQISS